MPVFLTEFDVAVSDERFEPGYVGLRDVPPSCDETGKTILALGEVNTNPSLRLTLKKED